MLKSIDSDLVISPYDKNHVENNRLVQIDICKNMLTGEYDFNEIKMSNAPFHVGMTFRTVVLQVAAVKLSEHCLYTDGEFITYPLPFVNNIYVEHLPIYQYRLGRADQSANLVSLKKHSVEYYDVQNRILKFWRTIPEEKIGALEIVKNRLVSGITDLFVLYCRFGMAMTRNYYRELLLECPELLQPAIEASDILNLYVKMKGLAYPLIKAYLNYKDKK